MRPTTASTIIDLRPHIHCAASYDHPKDVLNNRSLSISEKRAILASWASDAFAVSDCPSMRAPPDLRRPVHIREIFGALQRLDTQPLQPPGGRPMRRKGIARVPTSTEAHDA